MDTPKPKVVAEYRYCDRDGQLVAVKTRWQPGFDGMRPKDFSWKRPLTQEQKKGLEIEPAKSAWAKGLEAGPYSRDREANGAVYCGATNHRDKRSVDLPRVVPELYRLPELWKADPSRYLFVCEGEKDTDRLAGLGFVAVCGPNGTELWPLDWIGYLSDRNVVLVPHCDDPGVKLMTWIAGGCLAVGAMSIRWLDLPSEQGRQGYDVCDWLAGLDRNEAKSRVQEAVQSCQPWVAKQRRAS